MLIEFSCSNHKSIRQQVTFSFVAGYDKAHFDLTRAYHKWRILPSAVIYGANGSGKTNLIDALRLVKSLVTKSMNTQPHIPIFTMGHKSEPPSIPSTYKTVLVKNEILYLYELSLQQGRVVKETLDSCQSSRKKNVFVRNGDTVSFGRSFKSSQFTDAKEFLKPNRLFLSCVANRSSVKECSDVFDFFANDLVFCDLGIRDSMHDFMDDRGVTLPQSWQDYALRTIRDNPRLKQLLLKMLNSFGHDIRDISVLAKPVSPQNIPSVPGEDMVNRLAGSNVQMMGASVSWECGVQTDFIGEESSGLMKLVWFLVPFLEALSQGQVLICDELSSHFHELVIGHFIDIINLYHRQNQFLFPQFLITCHSSSLLNTDLFRRDQIWFTELNKKDHSTELYSLCEFKNVRATESIRRRYPIGKFGAVPDLNYDLGFLGEELAVSHA